jgi:hypothetical protein
MVHGPFSCVWATNLLESVVVGSLQLMNTLFLSMKTVFLLPEAALEIEGEKHGVKKDEHVLTALPGIC